MKPRHDGLADQSNASTEPIEISGAPLSYTIKNDFIETGKNLFLEIDVILALSFHN